MVQRERPTPRQLYRVVAIIRVRRLRGRLRHDVVFSKDPLVRNLRGHFFNVDAASSDHALFILFADVVNARLRGVLVDAASQTAVHH